MTQEQRLKAICDELLNIPAQMHGEPDDYYRERFKAWVRDVITAAAPVEEKEPEPSPGWEVVPHPWRGWKFALRALSGEYLMHVTDGNIVAFKDRKNAKKRAKELNA